MSETKLKLGSLFDGIAGFPLVGSWYGIEPTWASEIEEPCIRITKKHFPNMKHLGDITKIHGDQIEPVDVITGGSPCQDLSVAGKQSGIKLKCENCGTLVDFTDSTQICPNCGAELDFTRSGLFMEQIRIIREMREKTNNQYPRFAVWENVCFEGNTLITCEDGLRAIKDVHIGDKVKTLSGQYLPVVKCHKTKYQKVVRLKISGSEDVIVTENHPFYAIKKYHRSDGTRYFSKPEWVAVKDLTENHMIGYRLDVPMLPESFITDAEAWALGRWLADGSVDTNRSTPRIFISVGESKIDATREKLKELPFNIYENRVHKTAVNFTFTSEEFYNLIINAGKGAANKRVPSFVFKLPYRLQKVVLDGYVSGDGYIRSRGNNIELSATTVSRDLAYGIAKLIRNCYHSGVNICVSAAKDGIIDGRVIKGNHDVYHITSSITTTASLSYFDGTILWQPVKGIETVNKSETVYNLSVLEDNTYEANSIICHNCGAFSSNNGDDFFCVLQEFCKLMAERIPTFRPERWSTAGEILGESCSIAWRLFDAQYWGVPQRRRRIFLVADFGGQCAREILFKSESLRRHLTPSGAPWKRFTAKAESSTGESSRNTERCGVNTYNTTITSGVSSTLDTNCGNPTGQNSVLEVFDSKPICVATQQANAEIMTDVCPILTAANGTSGSNKPYVVLPESEEEKPIVFEPGASSRLGGHAWEDVTGTLTSQMGDNQMSVVTREKSVVYGFCSMSSNSMKSDNPDSGIYEADVSKTLDTNGLNPTCNQGGNAVVEEPVYCIQGNCIDRADTAGCNGKGWREDVSYTLTAMDRPAVAYGLNGNKREDSTPKAYGVWQNGNSDVGIMDDKTCTLTTGGGKPGQGYPCVLVEEQNKTDDNAYVAAFAYQQGGSMPTLPYGEKISPPLLSSQKTAVLIDNHGQDCRWTEVKNDVCPTLSANMGMGGNNTPFVVETDIDKPIAYGQSGYGDYIENRVSTLKCAGGDISGGSESLILKQTKDDDVYVVTDASHTQVCVNQSPLTARDYKDPHFISRPKSIVRRLTPLECERLQGYPDNWTASESDSARYKALGNSVALPCVDYIMSGIADVLDSQ